MLVGATILMQQHCAVREVRRASYQSEQVHSAARACRYCLRQSAMLRAFPAIWAALKHLVHATLYHSMLYMLSDSSLDCTCSCYVAEQAPTSPAGVPACSQNTNICQTQTVSSLFHLVDDPSYNKRLYVVPRDTQK